MIPLRNFLWEETMEKDLPRRPLRHWENGMAVVNVIDDAEDH